MRIRPIKTRVIKPPQDDLFAVLPQTIKRLPEQSVVVVASKVVSIHQGRCVPKEHVSDKDALIQREADRYLPRKQVYRGYAVLTIKHNILIPSAGIDESNAGEYYILWPRNPQAFARELHQYLKKTFQVKDVGVLIVDSHTVPLRRGTMGVALAYHGFAPVNDYRGKKDLFGRDFKVSTANVADGLAAAAVLAMGEGTEQTPVAVITEVPFVKFGNARTKNKDTGWEIPMKEDLYGPLLRGVRWRKGKNGK